MNKLRQKVRQHVPKLTRRKAIEGFVKHRYWYNQGNSSFAWLDDALPFQKFVVLMGTISGTSFAFEYIRDDIILGAVGATAILLVRAGLKWFTGRFWHYNDGYDIETQWNKGKVPPQRVELINADELAEQIAEAVASRLSTRMRK